MPETSQAWAEKIFAGDRRAISRAISSVENGDAAGRALLQRVFPRSGKAYIVGITGSPGVGKSTLVEKLAGEYRQSGLRVGILAVDPTSPFSGGAILGDRVRMQSLSPDEGVYIRSMATRGHLGGLSAAAQDAATILDAAGCGVILMETVGVGQDEVEIARQADATVLLLVPGLGDDVQTFKAGVMEIADLFAINKADRPGADRVEQEVTAMLGLGPGRTEWQPPVMKTVASTGEGVRELRGELDRFQAFINKAGFKEQRQRGQWRARLLDLLRQELLEGAMNHLPDGALDAGIEKILQHQTDPRAVVGELIEESGRARPRAPGRKR